MRYRHLLPVFVFSFVLISVPGCSRDPNAMKQKYLRAEAGTSHKAKTGKLLSSY